MLNYNNRIARRWNNLIRELFLLPRMRRRLKNKDVTILANNCNGGFIYHDLGLRFCSPTINMFFYNDHFFAFLEDLDYYLGQELRLAEHPLYTGIEKDYPICELGEGKKRIELHFLHYDSFEDAKNCWDKRKARMNKDNMFAIFSFFDIEDEEWLKRFDRIPIKNKVAFIERPLPQYKYAFYIKGYEKTGLGLLNEYENLWGCRKYDQFDYVNWFNSNEK